MSEIVGNNKMVQISGTIFGWFDPLVWIIGEVCKVGACRILTITENFMKPTNTNTLRRLCSRGCSQTRSIILAV